MEVSIENKVFVEHTLNTYLVYDMTPDVVFAKLESLTETLPNFKIGKGLSFVYGNIIVEVVKGGSYYYLFAGASLQRPGGGDDAVVMVRPAHELNSSWKNELDIVTSQVKYALSNL